MGVLLVLAGFLVTCKDTAPVFSPGASDPRVTGTWQLVERRFLKDSLYTIRQDTTTITRDTSFFVTRRYAPASPQTLTFATDGKLSAYGTEMTYYYPINYFRVDSTFDGLGVDLFITTNRATVPFRQGVAFQGDTLVLLPKCYRRDQCDPEHYLKFIRVR
ncbi:hypothetical protein HNV11_22340 [Spirosoma taeanense]|uniref:Uncharacterized protein n=1 Tax=Spirosoma taeanense TaxID=2735870 RepID=A0A6M5YEK9_9BACT|nr:hypothetical protein HNV11_22340 [Spirosoma taeanense]